MDRCVYRSETISTHRQETRLNLKIKELSDWTDEELCRRLNQYEDNLRKKTDELELTLCLLTPMREAATLRAFKNTGYDYWITKKVADEDKQHT